MSGDRLLHALVALLLARGSAFAPDYEQTFAGHAADVRSAILANYDRLAPPTSVRNNTFSNAGTDVGLQIRFFKMESVNMAEGTMSVKVWMRMSWVDTRLAWNPADYGGITQVTYEECPGELCTICAPHQSRTTGSVRDLR